MDGWMGGWVGGCSHKVLVAMVCRVECQTSSPLKQTQWRAAASRSSHLLMRRAWLCISFLILSLHLCTALRTFTPEWWAFKDSRAGSSLLCGTDDRRIKGADRGRYYSRGASFCTLQEEQLPVDIFSIFYSLPCKFSLEKVVPDYKNVKLKLLIEKLLNDSHTRIVYDGFLKFVYN